MQVHYFNFLLLLPIYGSKLLSFSLRADDTEGIVLARVKANKK